MAKRASTGARDLPRVRRIRTKGEVDALVDQVRQLEGNRDDERSARARAVAKLEAGLARERKALAKIDARYDRVIRPRLVKIRTAALEFREELTGDMQSVALATGTVRFRLSTVSLKVEDQELALASLRKRRLVTTFVRMIPQIDLAALRQRPEIYAKIAGISPERLERFSVMPAGLDRRFVNVLGTEAWTREPLPSP